MTGLPATLLAQTAILAIEMLAFSDHNRRDRANITRFLIGVSAFYSVGIAVSLLSEIALAAQIRAAATANEAIAERGRLRAALSCMTDGVVITDRRQNVFMLNPAAEQMFGSLAADVIGKPLFSIVQATKNDGVQYGAELVREAAAEGRAIKGTRLLTIRTPSNASLPVRYSASPMADNDGVEVGAVLVIHDETERQKVEERLRTADRRKDDFLATLAHELRNSLAPISTGLELMRLAADDPDAIADIRGRMERQALHIVRLVDDLLDVSRITRGKLSLKKELVDLSRIAGDVADAMRPKLTESALHFSVTLSPAPCLIEADRHRIAQVLTNLLDNAAKFTPKRGDVGIEAFQIHNRAVVRVTDSGVGIPVERQPDIFEMFTQLTSNDSIDGGKGLGIGLALSKSLVEMHGGEIRVNSEGKDLGSEFILTFPIASTAPVIVAPPIVDSEDSRVVESRRILVVDDNRDALVMLGRLLEVLGHSVQMASNGAEAITISRQWRPEIVFMDIGMPVLNGHETARRLRQKSWGRDMMLVATTGWAQEQDRLKSRESGFDHHLVKPINQSAIQHILSHSGRAALALSGQ